MQLKNLKNLILGFFVIISLALNPSELFAQNVVTKGKIRTTNDDGSRTITIKDGKKDFRIEYEGDIEISDDDREIVSISRNGYIEIKKTRFGKRRRLFIESEGGDST